MGDPNSNIGAETHKPLHHDKVTVGIQIKKKQKKTLHKGLHNAPLQNNRTSVLNPIFLKLTSVETRVLTAYKC